MQRRGQGALHQRIHGHASDDRARRWLPANSRCESVSGGCARLRRAQQVGCGGEVVPTSAGKRTFVHNSSFSSTLALLPEIQDDSLWALLAAIASEQKNLPVAQVAYAAIDEVENVEYLATVDREPNKDVKSAALAAFTGSVDDAERIYLQAGQTFRAIMLNLLMYRFERSFSLSCLPILRWLRGSTRSMSQLRSTLIWHCRALDLAMKANQHIDTVLAYRQQYLEEFGWKETNKQFLHQNTQVEVDWEHVQEQVDKEMGK